MVVNVDFGGVKNVPGAVAPRSTISAVKLSDDAMRRHERIAEYRNKANNLNANLQSAMDSLSSANADIDRLNGEIAKLRQENAKLRDELLREQEKSARLGKKYPKNQRFAGGTDSSGPR